MPGPTAAYLDGSPDGRLHLQHGPIDLVIGVDGGPSPDAERRLRATAFRLAHRRFQTVLAELVEELPLLKTAMRPGFPQPAGATARRMVAAVRPLSERFITPMAAVAGSVADEILSAMLAGFDGPERPGRIAVNNGGDIALHLDGGHVYRLGIRGQDGADLGAFTVRAGEGIGGVATSGRGGRSLSMGIADSVTVLAGSAASADAAATLIANAVDLPGHPAVTRMPANRLVDDSDLGDRLVTTVCGPLTDAEIDDALDRGAAFAADLIARGHIRQVALHLRACSRIVGDGPRPAAAPILFPESCHA